MAMLHENKNKIKIFVTQFQYTTAKMRPRIIFVFVLWNYIKETNLDFFLIISILVKELLNMLNKEAMDNFL